MDSQFENFVIETLDINQNGIKDEIHVTAVIDNTSFDLKVDSGAKCNVISTKTIKSLALCKKLQLNTKEKVKLVTYSKDTIKTMGTCVLNCKISDVTSPIEFQVVRQNSKSILGLKDALKLNLITLHPDVHEIRTSSRDRSRNPPNIPSDIWQEHSELFSDTPGCLPIKYKMKLNPHVAPVLRPSRKVPHAMKDKIKESLDKMEENGIIAKVSEPTEWVSSMVAAKKKNTDELRICIDPRDLNMSLMRSHHPLKTLDEVTSSIPGATVFFNSRRQKCILAHQAWRAIKLLHDVQLSVWAISLSTYAIRHFFMFWGVPTSFRIPHGRYPMQSDCWWYLSLWHKYGGPRCKPENRSQTASQNQPTFECKQMQVPYSRRKKMSVTCLHQLAYFWIPTQCQPLTTYQSLKTKKDYNGF